MVWTAVEGGSANQIFPPGQNAGALGATDTLAAAKNDQVGAQLQRVLEQRAQEGIVHHSYD